LDKESGNSRGFGYVTFADKETAQKAIDGMNDTELGRRKIQVHHSEE